MEQGRGIHAAQRAPKEWTKTQPSGLLPSLTHSHKRRAGVEQRGVHATVVRLPAGQHGAPQQPGQDVGTGAAVGDRLVAAAGQAGERRAASSA